MTSLPAEVDMLPVVGDTLVASAAQAGALDELIVARPRDASDAPVRVLHVINGEHYAGAERVQDLLAVCLPELGYEAGFACLKPGRFAAARQAQQTPLYDVAMRSRFDLRPACEIARLVKRDGYRIIHTHTSRSALLGAMAAAISGVPLVHHIHSAATPDTLRDLRDRISAVVERFAFRRADAVIAVSRAIRAYAQRGGVDDDRLSVVPNGVPAVERLGNKSAPSGPWTIGTVALFRERKGLEVLIEAVARLHAQGLPVRLNIVGPFETAEYEARVHGLADSLGASGLIDWRGFRVDIAGELAAMDLFVMPSVLREGLPMVLLEAMAAGVPIVASRVEGIPEVIRDCQDGLLVRPGDADDLAQALARMIRGDADSQALRSSAYWRQVSHFSDRSMTAGVARVYADVLARAGVSATN
jgi:glycosyltransferase involved in cell wall biosynthesis